MCLLLPLTSQHKIQLSLDLPTCTALRTASCPTPLPTGGSGIATLLPAPTSACKTYYFRKPFSLRNSACVSALSLVTTVRDGAVLYLNNIEVIRINMPAGQLYVDTKVGSRTASLPV